MQAEQTEEDPNVDAASRKRLASTDSSVIQPAKRGRRRKNKELEHELAQEPVTLFEIIRLGRVSVQSVVDDWIESYKANREEALINLVNFIIHSSGCKGTVTLEMYSQMEHSDIIRKMTEEFDEESGDYPLIMAGPIYKKFRSNFCEFVTLLVRQCQYSILYDQFMVDNLISMLTGLSDSQVRAFRHTSTLAAMKLMTALVNVALNLSVNLDNTQRQHDAERAKQTSKRASERIEMLLAKRQEILENTEEVQQMMNNIFRGIFVHRYRDTQPEIRAICMGEIGLWMKNYSEMFLSDSYLKYVGWTLHDKMGEVRLKCLEDLEGLYCTPELVAKLELFTNRFKDRIVSMTLDKETDVAVRAIKVCTLVLKFNEDILTAEDCENVYQLVYASSRAVAQAAGDFLNERLFKREETEADKIKRTKRRSLNSPLIRDLVQFFIESELHEHAAYLVDALWDVNDMVKDWDCMTELLLEEPGRGEEALDDRQETALIEIMVSAVRQAAKGHPPVGRGHSKRLLTSKEKKQVVDDRVRLTEHFVVKIPELLSKYNTDYEKVANLLEIPQHFHVEVYTTSRLEKHLDALLLQMRDIVEKHTETEVLDACAKTYECLMGNQYSTTPRTEVARNTLIDNLCEKLKRSCAFFQHSGNPTEEEVYALSSSMKRIVAFYSCHDMTAWEIWGLLFALVKRTGERGVLPDVIFGHAIACCHYANMWMLTRLDETEPDQNEMGKLHHFVGELIRTCSTLLLDSSNIIREESFTTICDLLVAFSPQLNKKPPLAGLIVDPSENLQGMLADFIQEHVFIEDDDEEDEEDADDSHKIEILHKRRNLLASFCKLIVFNIIEMKNASGIFKHYMKFYNDYGDIIKTTLAKSREINKISCARTLGLSLTQLYKEMKNDEGFDESRTAAQLNAIKELGRRFSLTFGLDQLKTRDAVAALHREGIQFSLTPIEDPANPGGPPPNLGYLEILTEFSSKLLKLDKKTVLQYLDKSTDSMLDNEGEAWSPLLTYRSSLLQGDTLSERSMPISEASKDSRKTRKKRGGLKRKFAMQGADGQWVAKDQPEEGEPSKKFREEDASSTQGSEREFEPPPQEEEEESEEDHEEQEFEGEGEAIQALTSQYSSTPLETHGSVPIFSQGKGKSLLKNGAGDRIRPLDFWEDEKEGSPSSPRKRRNMRRQRGRPSKLPSFKDSESPVINEASSDEEMQMAAF
ncbi:cohesin subunit SA-1-like isoform X2 [Apostichopus japonicus]|uniref:cohesin subunit SA-1-like isoform X2 n=1 Tax=Stichopus japonicus TaxID=307972 RepID=UPI003AB6E8B4